MLEFSRPVSLLLLLVLPVIYWLGVWMLLVRSAAGDHVDKSIVHAAPAERKPVEMGSGL